MTAPRVDGVPPLTMLDGHRSTSHGWAADGSSYVAFLGGNQTAVAMYVVAEVRRAEPSASYQFEARPAATRIVFKVRADDVAALDRGPMHRAAMNRVHHTARRALWACAAAGEAQERQ